MLAFLFKDQGDRRSVGVIVRGCVFIRRRMHLLRFVCTISLVVEDRCVIDAMRYFPGFTTLVTGIKLESECHLPVLSVC